MSDMGRCAPRLLCVLWYSYIQEILLHAALGEGRSVLMQGSLRNLSYHKQLFAELRQLYPGLKIAIVHVRGKMRDFLQHARAHTDT